MSLLHNVDVFRELVRRARSGACDLCEFSWPGDDRHVEGDTDAAGAANGNCWGGQKLHRPKRREVPNGAKFQMARGPKRREVPKARGPKRRDLPKLRVCTLRILGRRALRDFAPLPSFSVVQLHAMRRAIWNRCASTGVVDPASSRRGTTRNEASHARSLISFAVRLRSSRHRQ